MPTFSPVSIKSAAQRQAQLKTSFLLSSSVTLSLTLAGGWPESLAWKVFCLAVLLMNVNITQAGEASKLARLLSLPANACIISGLMPNLFTGLQIQVFQKRFIINGNEKDF